MLSDVSKSHLLFLKSAFSRSCSFIKTDEVVKWLKSRNIALNLRIDKIPLDKLIRWSYDIETGTIKHQTGKYFSIDGIRVTTNWGNITEWDQPIINQPEIGYLGFIVKEFHGVLHFLVQAKIEPGNVNYVQISPTLQATKSNYTQVHKGKKPFYLEYFQNATSDQILLDQLQSEQGSRFLKKRNRNIIIKITEEVPVYEEFIWLTLAQIKDLMRQNNLVNMDTRTVISGIPFGSFNLDVVDIFNLIGNETRRTLAEKAFLKSALSEQGALHSIENIITFLTDLKSTFDLEVTHIPLKHLKKWVFNDYTLHHETKKYFKVIAVDVEIENREVIKWTQPMLEPAQEGICAFVCKEINGLIHFAVQARLECGNHDIIEFAPTVQCLTGNYRQTKEGALPFLDYVLNSPSEKIYFDTLQSEEGGRFYQEQNRNMIIISGHEIPLELPPHYIWMTLNQLFTFIKFNNYLNIQARSLIAAISFA